MLRFDGVAREVRGRTLLHDLSFTVEGGEAVALLGANGSGKSTLLRLAARLDSPARGTVAGTAQRQTGYCPQSDPLWPDLSAVEHLDLAGALHKMPRPLRLHASERLLDALDLTRHATKPAATLSGGMRRRLSVALALLHAPKLLLLDEPFAGLDDAQVARVEALIGDAVRDGAAMLLATHDLAQATRLTSRFLLLRDGSLVRSGSSDALAAAGQPLRLSLSVAPEHNAAALKFLRNATQRPVGDAPFLIAGNDAARLLDLAAALERALPGSVEAASVRPVQLQDLLQEVGP